MKVVIVTGGRAFSDAALVAQVLDSQMPLDVLRHGGCRTGADSLADAWAQSVGVTTEVVPADWDQYGRSAGPRRNRRMAEMGAELCIAFPGGSGTADMVRQAKAHGIAVLEVKP